MELDVSAPEGDPQPPEATPEAPTEVQEKSPEGAAPPQEDGRLAALESEVARLKAESASKDQAVSRIQAQYQDMVAHAAQVEGRKERNELNRELEQARDDPVAAQAVVDKLRARLQRSETEEEVRTRTWSDAQQRIYEAERAEAYSNPAFADLTSEEKYRLEADTLGAGARTISAVTGVWANAIKERAAMSVDEQVKALRADIEALKNAQTGAALSEAGGPESPAPAGGGGVTIRTMADADEAYYKHEIDTPTYKGYRKQFGVE